MTNESEEKLISKDCINSPSTDEVNSTERKGIFKKGPWTSAEDAILVAYVNKHGEGNWNAVQKHSGLLRCGKSCRLRWANHLRPELKKGSFAPEEERLIIELHSKIGNKWARMAVELPGRTDNEIKNFWNTRYKRKRLAGLPIYPPGVSAKTPTDNTQTQNMPTFANGDTPHSDIFPNAFPVTIVEFKNLHLNSELYSSSFELDPTIANPPKRNRRSDTYICDGGLNDLFPKVNESLEMSSLYNKNFNCGISSSSNCLFSGSHAYFNGNTSSSEHISSCGQKLELPSLQYSTQLGSCNPPSSLLPSLESVDTLIQSTLIGQTKSNHPPSHRDSGLLEEVILQAQTLKMSENNNNSNASLVPRDITDRLDQDLGLDDSEAYVDPLAHSAAAAVFSDYNLHLSGSALEEHQTFEAISVKHEAEESGVKQSDREDQKPNQMKYSRPDVLLGSNWFGSPSNTDHNKDPITALLGDDICTASKHISGSPFEPGKWDDVSENH